VNTGERKRWVQSSAWRRESRKTTATPRRPIWRARLPSERDVARFSRRLALDGGQQVAVRVADTVVTGR
jgi:hypothetical protein